MRRLLLVLPLLASFLSAAAATAPARAQDAPAPAPAKKDPAKPVLTMDALLAKPADLPKGITLVDGVFAVSPQARNWYEKPHPRDQVPPGVKYDVDEKVWEAIPRPKAKSVQSFAAEGGVPGSVFLFEYDKDFKFLRNFLPAFLWGAPPGGKGRAVRTERHPEEILFHGDFVIILSYPRGDPAAEWFKDRLRREFRIPALRYRRELAPLMTNILEKMHAHDDAGGLKLLDENAATIGDDSFLWYMRGEFAVGLKDFKTAEKGYRKALELDRALVDPLSGDIPWAALDGLGGSLLNLRRLDEAVKTLTEAWDMARERKLDLADSSTAVYNLACALALSKKWEPALRALKESIEVKPAWKEKAREDSDFVEARKRPDFQELLK